MAALIYQINTVNTRSHAGRLASQKGSKRTLMQLVGGVIQYKHVQTTRLFYVSTDVKYIPR